MEQQIIDTKFDYNDLDTEVRISLKSRAEKIGERTRRAMADLWENGREFHEAQQELAAHGNGRFQAWVESETGYSVRTAYNFINVYLTYDRATVAQTTIPAKVLYLLSAPSTPEEARQEVLEAANQGATITHSRAKQVIESHKHPMTDEDQDAIIQANNEEFFKRFDQQVQQHRLDVADPDGRKPPSKCPRCHAAKSSVLVGSDHWRCKNCNREYDHTGKMPTAGQLVAAEYTYTAEIEQYVEAVDAAANEPRHLAVWELQSGVGAWLTLEFGHSKTAEQRDALLAIKDGKGRDYLLAIKQHIINHSYANTEPRPSYRANELKQAINNVCEQLRQRLEERERNAAILDRDQAIGELRLYLENAELELHRILKKHPTKEVSAAVTTVTAAIIQAARELKRATA